jgi:hypothetical protein
MQDAPVDSAFNQDESELGVLVLLVALQVLSDSHGLLNQHIQILGDSGGETCTPMTTKAVQAINNAAGSSLHSKQIN